MSNTATFDTYEGNESYLFISYSHRDTQAIAAVRSLLREHHVRYWYDNGLHSGDDWNLVIAKRLVEASVCLFLLSPDSAESEYVKNELNFAQNHRIPIHTLLLEQFEIPLDIEMMTGRIQMIGITGDYREKLINALPRDIFADANVSEADGDVFVHALFDRKELLGERQGTHIYRGEHKKLGYSCMILEDVIRVDEWKGVETQLRLLAGSVADLFPHVCDYTAQGSRLTVFQKYDGMTYLDDHLAKNTLDEKTILSWVTAAAQGAEQLFRRGYAFRDFARGSLIVTDRGTLQLLRAYHPYYGVVPFRPDTRQYYLEKTLQEIAVLTAQLCLGREPVLPLHLLSDGRFSRRFLRKINIVIQKCCSENGVVPYRSLEELLADLNGNTFPQKDRKLLRDRGKRLAAYDRERARRTERFVADDRAVRQPEAYGNPEEEFGFAGTVFLQDAVQEAEPSIRLRIASSGQIMDFCKKEILIGTGADCDMIWTQPDISRRHLKIRSNADGSYTVTDCGSVNGTYVARTGEDGEAWDRVGPGVGVTVRQGAKLRAGQTELRIL